jgi:ABC-type lipoprotein export system ATPase subunit
MSSWPIIEIEECDSDEDYLTHQCRRFRILVMGKAGVGKSTLLSMVFGIPEIDVGRAWLRSSFSSME